MGRYTSIYLYATNRGRPKKLISAVVAYVDHNGRPPSALETAFLAKQWGSLPDPGGLYDQDAKLIKQMTVLYNVYKTLQKFRNAQGAQIHQLTDADRRILAGIKGLDLI